MVPGGGAVEMELSRQVESFSETCEGLEQYAVKRFANALQVVPRILAENTGKYFVAQYSWTIKFNSSAYQISLSYNISGVKSSVVISKLLAAHQEGNANACFNIEAEGNADSITDAVEKQIYDLLTLKYWALKYATDAACTILRVDQIIMAKRAGGPKPKQSGPMDEDDD